MFSRFYRYMIVLLAVGIYYLYVKEYYSTGIDHVFAFLVLFVLYAAVFVYAVYRLVKDKRPIPLIKKAGPVCVSVLLALGFWLASWWVDTDGGKKVVMSAGYTADLTTIQLKLRDDHTFKVFLGGPFGGNYYRGRYELGKNMLWLYHDSLKHLYPTGMFIITTDSARHRYFEPMVKDNTGRMNAGNYRLEIESHDRK